MGGQKHFANRDSDHRRPNPRLCTAPICWTLINEINCNKDCFEHACITSTGRFALIFAAGGVLQSRSPATSVNLPNRDEIRVLRFQPVAARAALVEAARHKKVAKKVYLRPKCGIFSLHRGEELTCVSKPILRQRNAYWVGASVQRRLKTAYFQAQPTTNNQRRRAKRAAELHLTSGRST